MLCVETPMTYGLFVSHSGCKPNHVKRFLDNVNSQLNGPASELSNAIAKIDDQHFVGCKHARTIHSALRTLRSLCAAELQRKVTDAEVLCVCLYCLCSSCDHSFKMELMFDTRNMSPYEPLGNQNKAAWLMLKAALSIDTKHAEEVVQIVSNTMSDLMGVLGVFSLIMQTEFGVALFKCKPTENTMPVASAVLSSSSMLKVLTKSLDKLGANRPQTYEPTPEVKDTWFLLGEHILNTTEMAAAVVCRRNTTTIAVLMVQTSDGFVCFARRLSYSGGRYCIWSKQCAKDLRDNLRSVLNTLDIELQVPSKPQIEQIQARKATKGWWSVRCVDDTSSSNMQVARKAKGSHNSCLLNADGVFTGLVAVSFVSFFENT